MKKLVQLVVLIVGLQSFSQQIVLEKGRFFVEGKQISSRETKQLLLTDYKATRLFQKAKSKESIGGLLLGLGVALTVSDVAIGISSNVKYPSALTYAGVAVAAISIPILSGRSKKIKDAIDSYNESSKGIGSYNYDLNYHIVANQNGIGIQLKF